MSEGDLIPISDEQAKALQEAIKTLRGLGGFIEKVLGSVPEDVVGLLGGDWLRVRRAENIARMVKEAKERLEARGQKDPQPANLKVALPILHAAADESREELQALWARLLANAMDPARANRVRGDFIEAAKKLEPLDATVLSTVNERTGGTVDTDALTSSLNSGRDEIVVSVENLVKLGMMNPNRLIEPFGREFLRASEA